jgi:uncharacterized protein
MFKLLPLLLLCFNVAAQNVVADFNKAVSINDVPGVKRLLVRGVDPNTPDKSGDPALIIAARAGALEMVQALIAGRAKVNIRSLHGDTAIMTASIGGHFAIVRFLREKANAEINFEGWTPLAYAATGGHPTIVEYLLEQGANPNARSPNGTSALMMAVRELQDDAAKKLIEYGADIHAANDNGETPLSWAVRAENEGMISFLKKLGAKK